MAAHRDKCHAHEHAGGPKLSGLDLQALAVLTFVVGVIAFLALVVVPQMASSRLTLELSKVRSVLTDMCEEEPAIAEHPDVQRLDATLARTLSWGRAPGLSMLIAALVSVDRQRRDREPAAVAPRFRGLAASQRVALYLLGHRVSLEVVRASFFSSRLWFLAWPAWLLLKASIRRRETLQRDSDDDAELSRVVAMGTGFESRFLQTA
jgi:hypothetical protein